MDQPDPSRLRISDADRHKVAEVLREAAAEGRIDLDELDERLEAAYGAKVYGDLVPLTLDLPGVQLEPTLPVPRPQAQPTSAGMLLSAPTSSFAMMSGIDRKGIWRVPERHTAVSVMGGITIDLREVVFTARETIINATAIMGAVDVYVNAGTRVVVEGYGVMGAFEQGRDKVTPTFDANSPVVRVKGVALMGAVTVTRKRMPGEPGPVRKLLGH